MKREAKAKQAYAFIQPFFSRLERMCVQENSTSLLTLLVDFNLLSYKTYEMENL